MPIGVRASLCAGLALLGFSPMRHVARPADTSATSIGVRHAHAMTYDTHARRTILVAGADERAVRADSWTWDHHRRDWRQLSAGGPPGRTFPALAYDGARDETVLFGGNRVLFGSGTPDSAGFLDDTWVLRGSVWLRRDVTGPSARAEAATAYDSSRQRIVLFGGYAQTGSGRTRYGDTWEWDGMRWSLMATTGPAPRNGAALAYDDKSGVIVLSGGPPALVGADAWEWDGRSWRRRTDSPPARFNPSLVYHGRLQALLRFGGWTGTARTADTWLGVDGHWQQLQVPGPPARNHAAMAYDAERGRAVLFGGHDGERVFGDTWEFGANRWIETRSAVPQRRIDNGH
jgi:hypothetical protein